MLYGGAQFASFPARASQPATCRSTKKKRVQRGCEGAKENKVIESGECRCNGKGREGRERAATLIQLGHPRIRVDRDKQKEKQATNNNPLFLLDPLAGSTSTFDTQAEEEEGRRMRFFFLSLSLPGVE
ncbi:hypothetical protein IF1G_03948 [Cordyceps javanica]|uniref:Uncharacterized protein n=1 Tax=Cordyceps javanica TaxID=43265 RepID=A0A545V4R0_9HYPO|nr:hypothetical protein IF1G_03948 [Cordyceps javanica]